ncbi:hypothetical protein GCM10023238_32760 [Streptomyces heliomycini]|nr:hypothetical protein ADK58_34925 [Streptomyces sp. XY152]
MFIAEVKSPTGAREGRRIRPGALQVLDHAHPLRTARPGHRPRPVLVPEKLPAVPVVPGGPIRRHTAHVGARLPGHPGVRRGRGTVRHPTSACPRRRLTALWS